jgi:hypothetical protein
MQSLNQAKCVCARAHAGAFALPTGGAAVKPYLRLSFVSDPEAVDILVDIVDIIDIVDIVDIVVDIDVKGADAGASCTLGSPHSCAAICTSSPTNCTGAGRPRVGR